MAVFNHLVGVTVNPLVAGLLLVLLTTVLGWRAARGSDRCRRWAWRAGALAVVWLWFWSTPLACWLLGKGFDAAYPAVAAEDAPDADAIVVLGGGVAAGAEAGLPYPDFSPSSDRVWHGARLYRAGKAPRIVATGLDVSLSTAPVFRDFGIPDEAATFIDGPRNTEEESRAVAALLPPGSRILLVTSASHMRRSLLLFRNAGLDAISSPHQKPDGQRKGQTYFGNRKNIDVSCFFRSWSPP